MRYLLIYLGLFLCHSNKAMSTVFKTSAFSTITIEVFVASPKCHGDTGTIEVINATGGTPPYVFALNDENFSSNMEFTDLVDGIYQLRVQDANGCEEVLQIEIIEPIEVLVEISTNTFGDQFLVDPGETINLFANTSFIEDIAYAWFVDGELTSNDSNISLETQDSAVVFVNVFDGNACSASDTITVAILPREPIFVPNIFSPNNDGINDLLGIYGLANRVTSIKSLKIFNRKGNMVFIQENFPINSLQFGWDGFFKGKKLNPQVFIYVLEYVLWNGEEEVKRGDFILAQ